jgi:chorismate mutase
MSMPVSPADDPSKLGAIREEIDRIDAAMHDLLMQRGELIDRLIAAKRTGESGSAFRPQREADKMRSVIARHRGNLPISCVESIWRTIISTFTYVQAPHALHVDFGADEERMRDTARFHFGFIVPLVEHDTATDAIAAVAASAGDLGLVHAGDDNSIAWWLDLVGADDPKVIARLPFVQRSDHPVGYPAYVVAKPVGEARARDLSLYALTVAGADLDLEAIAKDLVPVGGRLVDASPYRIEDEDGAAGSDLLIELPGAPEPEEAAAILSTVFDSYTHLAFVGSYAA